jgi:cytochrome c-type biogenesis protein CcmE
MAGKGIGDGEMKPRKVKFVAGFAVIGVCFFYLVVTGFQNTSMYYFTVSELEARETEFLGRRIKLAGRVVPNTIKRDDQGMAVRFTIWEPTGSEASSTGLRTITYNGIVPDTFKDEADVVLEGVTGDDGVFKAETLLAKCPSKYEGKSYEEMKEVHEDEKPTTQGASGSSY